MTPPAFRNTLPPLSPPEMAEAMKTWSGQDLAAAVSQWPDALRAAVLHDDPDRERRVIRVCRMAFEKGQWQVPLDLFPHTTETQPGVVGYALLAGHPTLTWDALVKVRPPHLGVVALARQVMFQAAEHLDSAVVNQMLNQGASLADLAHDGSTSFTKRPARECLKGVLRLAVINQAGVPRIRTLIRDTLHACGPLHLEDVFDAATVSNQWACMEVLWPHVQPERALAEVLGKPDLNMEVLDWILVRSSRPLRDEHASHYPLPALPLTHARQEAESRASATARHEPSHRHGRSRP